MAAPKLRVFPNKFAALDGDGNPAGAYPEEGAPGIYIGATISAQGQDPSVGEMLAGKAAPPRTFSFDDETVELPATNHYLYALRTGELLPADARTANEAGVKFVPVAEALAAAKAKAVAVYLANHGELPACAREDAAPAAPEAPPSKADITRMATAMAKAVADDEHTDGGS